MGRTAFNPYIPRNLDNISNRGREFLNFLSLLPAITNNSQNSKEKKKKKKKLSINYVIQEPEKFVANDDFPFNKIRRRGGEDPSRATLKRKKAAGNHFLVLVAYFLFQEFDLY